MDTLEQSAREVEGGNVDVNVLPLSIYVVLLTLHASECLFQQKFLCNFQKLMSNFCVLLSCPLARHWV
jgi:hypothetical protein